MDKPQPNYYAVVPASVRYDAAIPEGSKLLYGEITALANVTGYCWASNNYFASLYSVTTRSVQRWLESLSKRGHIRIEIIRGKDGAVEERRIWINKDIREREGWDVIGYPS